MGEDMTYAPVQTIDDVRRDRDAVLAANGTLNKRVRELEAQLNAAVLGQRELERENAELSAKLDAVPVNELLVWRNPFSSESLTMEALEAAWVAVDTWLDAQAVQP